MNDEEMTELIGLYLDEQLPELLRENVERHLAAHPDAARDVQTQRETIAKLHAAPEDHADDWFIERALDGLLRESSAARQLTFWNELKTGT